MLHGAFYFLLSRAMVGAVRDVWELNGVQVRQPSETHHLIPESLLNTTRWEHG